MEIKRIVKDINWIAHPTAPGVQIKPFISKKDQGLDVTCMLIDIPVGKEVPEHIHQDQDDILYPLSGSGMMWVDGVGSFDLEPGVVVQVPKGTKHKIYEIKEDLLIYDVFSPALL